MLRHMVLFKFEEHFLKEEHVLEYRQVFERLQAEVSGILCVKVLQNSIDRSANMDLMVVLDLEDESVLSSYLQHPLHLSMGEKYNPHVCNRVSFDYVLPTIEYSL